MPPLKEVPRSAEDWDARYQGEEPPPWDTGRVTRQLAERVEDGTLEACRTLEVGCGTGRDSLWLASKGFEVLGIDLSPTAIEGARSRAADAKLSVTFEVGPFPKAGDFRLVYDCGCFHTLVDTESRAEFVAGVAGELEPGGRWLSLIGSTDGPPRDHGPPRRSATEVMQAIEPHFEILSLVNDMYEPNIPTPVRAWIMLARKRTPLDVNGCI